MKKIVLFLCISSMLFAKEIFPETYVMQKTLLDLEKAKVYVAQSEAARFPEVYALRFTKRLHKHLAAGDSSIYFMDSDKKTAKLGPDDYLIAPKTLSRIYAVKKEDFEKKYRGK